MRQEEKTRQQRLEAIHEEIVAYLDGELTPEQAARVESRLADRPDYQKRLQDMQQAWDLLDSLPQVDVDESFSRSTLEIVALSAEEDLQGTRSSSATSHRRQWFSRLGYTLISAAAGLALAVWLTPRAQDKWLQDLPVIENVDMYLHIDSVEFLKSLHEEDLFKDEENGYVG